MHALDPTDGQWWWTVASDGLIAGVVGGAVTATTVILTLRHQRRNAEIESALESLVRLQAAASGLILLASRKRTTEERAAQAFSAVFDAAAHARSRLVIRWPEHNAELEKRMEALAEAAISKRDVQRKIIAESEGLIRSSRLWIEDSTIRR